MKRVASLHAEPRRKKGLRKKRNMDIADVDVSGVERMSDSVVAVPQLTEDRINELDEAMYNLRGAAQCSCRTDANDILPKASRVATQPSQTLFEALAAPTDLPPSAAKGGRSPRRAVASQAFAVTAMEELQLTLQAYYKVQHGRNGLRAHEELAVNVGVNVADIIHLEGSIAAQIKLAAAEATHQLHGVIGRLPPLSLFMMHLFAINTGPLKTLLDEKADDDESSAAAPTKAQRDDPRSELMAKLRVIMMQDAGGEKEDARPMAEMMAEISGAAQLKRVDLLSKWCGCTSVVLATMARMHEIAPQVSPMDPETGEMQEATFYHTVSYADGELARAAVERLVSTVPLGGVLDMPVLLRCRCLKEGVSVDELVTKLAETEEFDDTYDPDTAAGQSAAQRAAKMCANYDRTTAAACDLHFELLGCRSNAASLAPFAIGTAGVDAVIMKPCTMTFVSFTAAENRLVFEIAPAEITVNTSVFFDTVLGDARKADLVASTIHNRLSSQFIRPHHCHRHTAQKYSHFCRDCGAFICLACLKELHAFHDVVPHAPFCADEMVRHSDKKAIVLRRLERLKELRADMVVQGDKMHTVVDAAVVDVEARIRVRQQLLHADTDVRAAKHVTDLDAEIELCRADEEKIAAAMAVVEEIRRGAVVPRPSVKLHDPDHIRNGLHLRLPTTEFQQLVRVLTWSNASQYLTHRVYPPE
jgi:hypothetical protein